MILLASILLVSTANYGFISAVDESVPTNDTKLKTTRLENVYSKEILLYTFLNNIFTLIPFM